ncbi:diguanylate cyclase response regulator [filamentous cyanobacterium CCP2]|nr:diguanylate cyclase response regulator [filamentous cyanobacterium CCP2]
MTALLQSTAQINILVVDDTLDNLRLLGKILESQRYTVLKSLNGRMALQAAHRNPPDLILIDINMPEMSGYEVCQQLKASETTANIPVIFISALDQVNDKVRAFEMGGQDYITKPFQELEVIARVQNQLLIQQQKRQLRQEIETRKQAESEAQQLNKILENLNANLERQVQTQTHLQQQLETANRNLQRLASIDGLTQIANRRCFDEYLDQEHRRMKRSQFCAPGANPVSLSLILCDIDYFKLYNDTYGHQAGDLCLQQVAQTLSNVVNRPMDLVARYGGEEFVILLPETDAFGAVYIAEQICTQVRALAIPHLHSLQGYVTISAGVATVNPCIEAQIAKLISMADQALYQAKQEGRDRFRTHIEKEEITSLIDRSRFEAIATLTQSQEESS